MNQEEIETKIKLYQQALSLVFCTKIAEASRIKYHESRRKVGVFWVNKARWNQNGSVILSSTGWKSYTPEEFEAETQRLFNQAMVSNLDMREALDAK